MLRKKNEKQTQVKDETYYARKMDEVRAKTKDLALMACDVYLGTYQVWSLDSDDEEVRKSSHSAFLAYDVDKIFSGNTSETVVGKEDLGKDVACEGLGYEGFGDFGHGDSGMKKALEADAPKVVYDDSSDDEEEFCLMANDTRLTIPEQRENQ